MPQTHYNLGLLLVEEDQLDVASQHFTQAIELDAGHALAFFELGHIMKYQGRIEDALVFYSAANKLLPDDGRIYRALVNLQADVPQDTINKMQALLKTVSQTSDKSIHLHFALARAYEKNKDYAVSFEYLKQANALYRSQINFDSRLICSLMGSFQRVFTREFVEQRRHAGFPSKVPIFIVGMPRSGTSLTEAILNAHSRVHGADELNLLNDTVNNIHSTVTNMLSTMHNFSDEDFMRLGRFYIDGLPQQTLPIKHVIDKMPFNFMWIGLIKMILPEAKIIHCYRSPYDTCLSCYQHFFADNVKFSYDLTELGEYYVAYNQLMRYWSALFGDSIYSLKYEDLVQDQAGETRRLLEFCDLEWEISCMNYSQQAHTIKTASAAQVRQQINRDSIGKWQHYQQQLQPLINIIETAKLVEV